MCHINAVFKKKDTRQHTAFVGLLQAATGYSFIENSDGEGAFFSSDKSIVKNPEKINYITYAKKIVASNAIITHQRLATSGFSAKYTHPFENEEFVIVHNGIIQKYARHKKSDTFVLFNTITEEFKKLRNEKTREENIVQSIKNALDKEDGSFSILLYDKITGLTYYFKNYATTIHFWRNSEFLYVGTADISVLLPKMKELKIDPLSIYRIDENADVTSIAELQGHAVSYPNMASYLDGAYGTTAWVREWSKTEAQEEKEDHQDGMRYVSKELVQCERCQRHCYLLIWSDRFEMSVCTVCEEQARALDERQQDG